jgi:hypothetical protein
MVICIIMLFCVASVIATLKITFSPTRTPPPEKMASPSGDYGT